MYRYIRDVPIIIAGIVIFLKTRKQEAQKRRKKRITAIWILAIALTVLEALPIENIIVSFPSPEAVCRYVGYGEPTLVLEGESSAFLVIQENSDATLLGVQKAKNGWKIERIFQLFRVKTVFTDGCVVSLYRFGGSEDYYVIANKMNGGEKNVADNRASDFQIIAVSDKALDQTDTTYYAYVYQPGEGYAVTIDEITVHVT